LHYQRVQRRRNQGPRTAALGVSGHASVWRHLECDPCCCKHYIVDAPPRQPHDEVRFMNIGRPQRGYIGIVTLVEPDLPHIGGRRQSHHNPRGQKRTET
jgi:hypothetical protein